MCSLFSVFTLWFSLLYLTPVTLCIIGSFLCCHLLYLIIYLLGFKFLKSQLWIPAVKYRLIDLRVVTLLRFKLFQHCKKIVYSIFNIDVVCDSVVDKIILILYSGRIQEFIQKGAYFFFGLKGGGMQPLLGPQNSWKS